MGSNMRADMRADALASRYRGFIFDLDGTVYLSARLLPGAGETVEALRSSGKRVLFVSNNPLGQAAAYAERLTALGIRTRADEVITSAQVLASWLREHTPGARLLVLGEEALRVELAEAGLVLAGFDDQTPPDVVVASFDRTFDYERWTVAFRALRAGARFVATNPDPTCPVDGGEIPDCGGVIAALEATSGRRVEVVAGKPSSLMVEAALDRLRLPRDEVLIVGDRLETDIAMATEAGVDAAVVLTGVTDLDQVDAARPAPRYVLRQGLPDLLENTP